MRKSFIILVFYCINLLANSQNIVNTPFSVQTGIQLSGIDGVADLGGHTEYLELNCQLTNIFSVSPKLLVGYANSTSEYQFRTGTLLEYGINIKARPFIKVNNRFKFSFDIGGFKYTERTGYGYIKRGEPNNKQDNIDLNPPTSLMAKGFNFGWGFNFDIIKNNNMAVGISSMWNQKLLVSMLEVTKENPHLLDLGVYARINLVKSKLH